jgi:hypothetical protein
MTMKTPATKLAALLVVLLGPLADAKPRAQCHRDVKEFVRQCEKACEQTQKKNPRAADGCKNMCRTQSVQFDKGCDNGKL